MTDRHPQLAQLLAELEQVFKESEPPLQLKAAAEKVFRALDTPCQSLHVTASRLKACDHLAAALDEAEQSGSCALAKAAQSMRAIERELPWAHRKNSEKSGDRFHNGHANAILIGPGGLEERSDVWLGVSLLAPNVSYPFHKHPPEELYIVMSDGSWYREDVGWFDPGQGGFVFNPSNTVHSMKSNDKPLLAFWYLWSEDTVTL